MTPATIPMAHQKRNMVIILLLVLKTEGELPTNFQRGLNSNRSCLTIKFTQDSDSRKFYFPDAQFDLRSPIRENPDWICTRTGNFPSQTTRPFKCPPVRLKPSEPVIT